MDEFSIVDEAIKTMPEPSAIADQRAADDETLLFGGGNSEPTQTDNSGPTSGGSGGVYLRDRKGNLFDPSIHVGPETLTKGGEFAKKRGRKSGQVSTGSPRSVNVDGAAARQQASQLGKVTADTIFMAGVSIFGDEWMPIIDTEKGVNEPAAMQDAWARYFEATGKTDVPPWLGVCIVMGMYSLPRTMLPKTRGRLARFGDWCKARIFDVLAKRKARKG